jgi:hypothetical protein
MTTTAYLFEDNRVEDKPFCLFIEGFEPDEDDPDYDPVQTLEVRFSDLWEAAESLYIMKVEFSEETEEEVFVPFLIKLGEPEHYKEVIEEREEEGFSGQASIFLEDPEETPSQTSEEPL